MKDNAIVIECASDETTDKLFRLQKMLIIRNTLSLMMFTTALCSVICWKFEVENSALRFFTSLLIMSTFLNMIIAAYMQYLFYVVSTKGLKIVDK